MRVLKKIMWLADDMPLAFGNNIRLGNISILFGYFDLRLYIVFIISGYYGICEFTRQFYF